MMKSKTKWWNFYKIWEELRQMIFEVSFVCLDWLVDKQSGHIQPRHGKLHLHYFLTFTSFFLFGYSLKTLLNMLMFRIFQEHLECLVPFTCICMLINYHPCIFSSPVCAFEKMHIGWFWYQYYLIYLCICFGYFECSWLAYFIIEHLIYYIFRLPYI
jgi:hypothetical protein